MKKAFKPLKLNVCPMCHKASLCLVEKEFNVFAIDQNGFTIGYNEYGEIPESDLTYNNYEASLVCGNCHEKFQANSVGNRWFIVDDRPVNIASIRLSSYNPFDKRG